MPHQCTDCGRAFDDGSKEMLSGCPNCGGNTFQFKPDRADDAGDAGETAQAPPEPPEPAVDSSVARTVGSAATAVRDLVGGDQGPPEAPTASADDTATAEADTGPEVGPASEPSAGVAESSASPTATSTDTDSVGPTADAAGEDAAQASARSDVVPKDSLPPAPDRPLTTEESVARHGTESEAVDAEEARDRPDLAELREELNEQFESIKVLEPGQYELNLMELYDREEYIIALQEDGKYTIQVPEGWQD